MSSVVIELQREALDRNVRVSDLLRKVLVVAKKLNLQKFQAWVEKELNGYGTTEDIPDYRMISGQIRAWNPYRGWIPLIFEDANESELLSHRKSRQAIAELENLIDRSEKGSSLHMPFPQELQRRLSEIIGLETEISLFADCSDIARIIDSVRTIILNWALKLEEDGILGEGLSFSSQEQNVASRSPQNITNFYGPVLSPQIQQGSPQAIQVTASISFEPDAVRAFIENLRDALRSLQITPEQKLEAEAELQTMEAQVKSPKPKSSILRESLSSIRRILESAGGGAAAHLLVEVGKPLI